MLHTVLPIPTQARLHDFVLLGVDAVSHASRVVHRDFFIPPLVTHHFLALEGIKTGYGHRDVGKLDTDSRVAHILLQIKVGRQVHPYAREVDTQGYRRRTCRLGQGLRVVQRVQVVAIKARRSIVDAGRQCPVRIGLRILRMVPLHGETGGFRIVLHILVASLRDLIVKTEGTVVAVAFAVVRQPSDSP